MTDAIATSLVTTRKVRRVIPVPKARVTVVVGKADVLRGRWPDADDRGDAQRKGRALLKRLGRLPAHLTVAVTHVVAFSRKPAAKTIAPFLRGWHDPPVAGARKADSVRGEVVGKLRPRPTRG